MKLHHNKEIFLDVIEAVSDYTKIPEEFIEKDYYVSLLLKQMVELYPHIVFKGGTSLSKCYKLINRFSEDIDISVQTDVKINDKSKRELKDAITKAISKSKLSLINTENIKTRRNFNQYKVEFESITDVAGGLRNHLLVESYLFLQPTPYENKEVSNYIYDYLIEEKHTDIIEEFELSTFRMKVQRVDRTFVDKIFAICDYFEEKSFTQNSRHLYDLHKIWTNNAIVNKDSLKTLMKKVATDRANSKINISAQNNYNLKVALNNIINSDAFKDDYNEITDKLLYSHCSYEEVKSTLQEIINSSYLPEYTEHID